MSFVSFFKQLLLNYQKYWIWLKFLMVAKWTHVIFPLPQFSATVLLHSTWNVHLLLITNKWGVLLDFHLPLSLPRTIRRTTEKLRYYQIESFEQSRELSLSFVCVLQTSNSRKWTKWVGSFCWPFCPRVTCCLTTTIWPPVRNLTVLVHVFVDKFVNIIPYKLNAKQTKNIECMYMLYNVFLNCNIALVYELICWNQCLMEKLWIEFMDLIIKHHK